MTRNAHSVAASRGYPFVDTSGGACYRGVFFNRFLKTPDEKGKALFVGYDHDKRRWLIYPNHLPQEAI